MLENQDQEEATGMRLNHLKTRIWLALAVAIASLGLVSSASAMPQDGPVVKGTPSAAAPGSGFEWGYTLLAAGLVVALTVAAVAVVHATRNRARLAT
jgi:hypothetical protein